LAESWLVVIVKMDDGLTNVSAARQKVSCISRYGKMKGIYLFWLYHPRTSLVCCCCRLHTRLVIVHIFWAFFCTDLQDRTRSSIYRIQNIGGLSILSHSFEILYFSHSLMHG
jgi:hypothetical protein